MKRLKRVLNFVPAIAIASVVIAALVAGGASPPPVGLQNPGFEDAFTSWTVTEPTSGNASVVTTETPAMYPVYGTMNNVVVAPVTGSKMLRLGVPKQKDNHQLKGVSGVSQTFVTETDRLALAFRIFSTEHRPERDALVVNVKTADGASVGKLELPVAVTLPAGKTIASGPLPYRLSLDTGAAPWFDSGWVVVRVLDLPVNEVVTLSYTLDTNQDAAHDSWVYIDWWNRPPKAEFVYSPDDPHEGDVVGLFGENSSDPDEVYGDRIAKYEWSIISGSKVETATGVDHFWLPPDQGDYTVRLKVTDSYGGVGTTQTVIAATPFAPMVNAIDTEVLDGSMATAMARTIDQGWLDDHTATWSIASAASGQTEEDHVAALSSGIASALVSAGSQHSGERTGILSVADADSPSAIGTDVVNVRVVPNDPQRFEGQGSLQDLDGLPELNSDWSYLSWIQQAGDIDVFEVKSPEGEALTQGTEVLVTLKDLPADYDLVVLTTVPAEESPSSLQSAPLSVSPWSHSPWSKSPWSKSPWSKSPWSKSPWSKSPWSHSPWSKSPWSKSPWSKSPWSKSPFTGDEILRDPWDSAPWSHSPWSKSPWSKSPWSKSPWSKSPLDGYPFAAMAYTGLDEAQAGGTDIDPGEVGLDLTGISLKVAGTSCNRGASNEVVLASTDLATTRVFVAVVGHNGASSSLPFRLQLETSRPLDLLELANAAETPEPLVDNPTSTSAVTPVAPSPQTLFVTQRERLVALYGEAETASLLNSLTSLCADPKVLGSILSVPGDIYTAWDLTPTDIEKANGVANAIRSEIRAYLANHTSIRYVVLVGDDTVVPYRRVVDETVISNEKQYSEDSGLNLNSPLLASIYGGFNLTDDYYVDDEPIPWQGRALYLPDRAVSRLVETPGEMRAQIDAFVASGGVLRTQTALISGYDFMADGAQQVADILSAAGLSNTVLNNATWTAAELKSWLLASPKDVPNANAHYTHYAGLSAWGFERSVTDSVLDTAELLKSSDLAGAAGGWSARLFFTMGCHAGLSAPDKDASEADTETGLDPAMDFAQVISGSGGLLVGSTGFGLGDTEGIAGTEALMGVFAQQATSGGGISVGEALAQAKKKYIMGLSAVTTYDEKSSIQFALYGLPQWTLPAAAPAAPLALYGSGAYASAGFSIMGVEPSPFKLRIIDGATVTEHTYTLREVAGDSGTYYTANGDAQFTAFRPAQPRIVVPIAEGGDPIHGIIYRDAIYADHTEFDPAVARPTTEWEINPTEPQIAVEGWWPNEPAVINNDEAGGSIKQTLVVNPGQFKRDIAGSMVAGTERLYSELTVEIVRSSNTVDYVPPTVTDLRLARMTATSARVSVKATDESGIGKINVVDLSGTSLGSADFAGTSPDVNGYYNMDVTVPSGEYALVVQVADVPGNVTTVTGKGSTITPLGVTLTTGSPTYALGAPVTFVASISDFASLTGPVFYDIRFGDGSVARGITPSGTVTFAHTYSTPAAAPVVFTAQDASGGTGSASVTLVLAGMTANSYVSPTGSDTLGDGSLLSPFATFTHAITNTVDGGTVWALPGDYTEYIYLIRPVNLRSTDTSDLARIQGSVPNRAIIEIDFLSTPTLIEGFRLDGSANSNDFGGAVEIRRSSVEVSGCVIFNSTALQGGAISVAATSAVTITGCQFNGNHATAGSGGAIDVSGSTVTVTRSGFAANEAIGHGGAISLRLFSTATMSDTGVIGNVAGQGGGVSSVNSTTTIVGGAIRSNVTSATPVDFKRGGGVYAEAGPLTVEGTEIGANQAHWGAGLCLYSGAVSRIDRCTIKDNLGDTDGWGAGIAALNSPLTLVNSVVANNLLPQIDFGSSLGGGLYINGESATLVNDTIFGNESNGTAGIYSAGVTSTVMNSVVDGNEAGGVSFVYMDNLRNCLVGHSYVGDNNDDWTVTYGVNNLRPADGVPGMIDPWGGDYRLSATSICVDRGAPTWAGLTAPLVDIDGAVRPQGYAHDMGAYESGFSNPLAHMYVSATGSDANIGTADLPVASINTALARVSDGGTVHVLAGTYNENVGISRAVDLTSEDGPLAATIHGLGDWHALRITGPGAHVSGFVITGGHSGFYGGGVSVQSTGFTTIRDSLVATNTADGNGGGISVTSGGLNLLNTQVRDNVSGESGGGLAMESGAPTGTIESCQFVSNTAIWGGGVWITGGHANLVNVEASNNIATASGGGLFFANGAFNVIGARIAGNIAASAGGGAMAVEATGFMANSIVDGNATINPAGTQGGGVYLNAGSQYSLFGNDIIRNSAQWGSGVFNDGGLSQTLFNCVLWQNSGSVRQCYNITPNFSFIGGDTPYSGGVSNIAGPDPGFVDVLSNDFDLAAASVCRNAGTPALGVQNALPFDILGRARPNEGAWDIGAYEYY